MSHAKVIKCLTTALRTRVFFNETGCTIYSFITESSSDSKWRDAWRMKARVLTHRQASLYSFPRITKQFSCFVKTPFKTSSSLHSLSDSSSANSTQESIKWISDSHYLDYRLRCQQLFTENLRLMWERQETKQKNKTLISTLSRKLLIQIKGSRAYWLKSFEGRVFIQSFNEWFATIPIRSDVNV